LEEVRMKTPVRALKVSHLSELVLIQLRPWVAYCHNSWWIYAPKKEGGAVWKPVDALSLLARVHGAANEQVATKELYDDPDYVQLVAELRNVRTFQQFLRQLKVDLFKTELPAP
jgi:hypothetical protein